MIVCERFEVFGDVFECGVCVDFIVDLLVELVGGFGCLPDETQDEYFFEMVQSIGLLCGLWVVG